MAKEFQFKGVWIPAKVFTDARLTPSDKFLFGMVYILTNDRGCFATRETLASYMNQSVRNTQYSISRLIDCGYVRRDDNGVLWDIISHTMDRGEKIFTTPVKKSSSEGCKNLHPDSNTKIDTTDGKAQVVEKPLVDDAFIRSDNNLSMTWDIWLERRRARRWATSADYISNWNKQFSVWGHAKAIDALNQSLLQGWQGLFEPKGQANTRTIAPKGDSDHAKGF